MCKHCQTEAGCKDCLHSKSWGPNVECCSRVGGSVDQSGQPVFGWVGVGGGEGQGADMAALNSLGRPHILPQTVWGTTFFATGTVWGGGGGGGDQLKYDMTNCI